LDGEVDGPEEMYVILLDNGRTHLLEQDEQYLALKCLKCGACLNVCPIYKNIGGYTFESIYGGPIGSLLTPYLSNFKDHIHLSYACSICGRCTEDCPVQIPLHNLFLANRRDAVQQGYTTPSWDLGMRAYQELMVNRRVFDLPPGLLKNLAVGMFGKSFWGPRRMFPSFAGRSFSSQARRKLGEEMDN
jgi:L-lactate dehydrogenase complex protein LldF